MTATTLDRRADRRTSESAAGRRRRSDLGPAAVFLSPAIIGLTVFTLFPIVMSLFVSLFDWPAFGTRDFVGGGNFVDLLTSTQFRRVIANTVLYTVLYLPLNIIVSLGLALWIASMGRGRQALRVIFFLPVVTPIVAQVLVWRLMYQPDGVIAGLLAPLGIEAPNFLGDSSWAMISMVLMSVWQGFGYNMLIFSAALDQIPQSIEDAASVDGVGVWQRFWHVKLPMISPMLFFATTMTLITTFQVFAQPMILTGGGPGDATETLVLFIYRKGFSSFALGTAAAAGWFLFALILIVTLVQFASQRKWVNYDV
ncbi:carbohydrate ABC transporter permease [Microlunatus soli]|uniref:Multiple sugar transport system permease protein n=1 Tax=Microlunatus soli TaxID=630515 RepID=A0A1H1Z5A8_9ACTN|nr:sugar ABC transporter permease [Microlunatus soli]SDT28769.1 multiple sugar transport system permease protein [Microlunatus soli]